jgi:hypothetical protein
MNEHSVDVVRVFHATDILKRNTIALGLKRNKNNP